jgi:hypothetical protein
MSETLVLPDYQPLATPQLPPNLEQLMIQAADRLKAAVAARPPAHWWDPEAQMARLGSKTIRRFLDTVVNGKRRSDRDPDWLRLASSVTQLGFRHLLRMDEVFSPRGTWLRWDVVNFLTPELSPVDADLRAVFDIIAQEGAADPVMDTVRFYVVWQCSYQDDPKYADSQLKPELAWPFFSEHPQAMEILLGQRPGGVPDVSHIDAATLAGLGLQVLAAMPQLPSVYWDRVIDLAVGEAKRVRPLAQRVAGPIPDVAVRVRDLLAHGSQTQRVHAARWLAQLGDADSVPALRTAVLKESRPAAKAELLAALSKLGADIDEFLSPTVLTAEAAKILSRKLPADIQWFPFSALPALRWADGSPVDAKVAQWWVILACTLKEPRHNDLLDLYLDRLDSDSCQVLAEFVLDSFVAYDTRRPSDAEARAYADPLAAAEYQRRLATHQKYPATFPHPGSVEAVHALLMRFKLSEYLGSAIKAKGILALTGWVPATRYPQVVRDYERHHNQRRSQLEAFLMACAHRDDPEILSMLVRISQRFPMDTIRDLAAGLVAEAAERLGWTSDQLADRTVPTAGFDHRGILELYYGPKPE